MHIHKLSKIGLYVRFLQDNPIEVSILFKELLIGVSSFFRDPTVWSYLKSNVIPDLILKCQPGQVLRAWIPGCSTGEEAYSLAIIFKEVLERSKSNSGVSLQIFATDIDSVAIEEARRGIFKNNVVAEVTSERLARFFIKTEEGYRANADIREMIIFASHNIIMDPPFTKLDILSCRNLLIYLENELQKKLLSLFHYSLNPGGLLTLGSAETIGHQTDLFLPVEVKFRIYKRSETFAGQGLIDFPSSFSYTKLDRSCFATTPTKTVENIQMLADQLILQQYAPASVLANDKGDILYINGRTGKYLEPATGKVNWNILVMVRDELRAEFPAGFRKAIRQKEAVVLHKFRDEDGGKKQAVDVTIQSIERPDALKGLVLITFSDAATPIIAERPPLLNRSLGKKHAKSLPSSNSSNYEHELERELQRSRQELQSTIEEMQTSQEELKSTNEELQSTNEELQSTNEELTTSKEEMQSLNEELQTVNLELQNKVDDYSRINNDMKNLLNSFDVATLFLDKQLNIRRYTNQATRIFKMITSDVGRPFTDLVTDLDCPNLAEYAQDVLHTLVFQEREVSTRDGRSFNMRIMPYRTLDDHIDGVVITFVDISKSARSEVESKRNQGLMESLFESLFDKMDWVNVFAVSTTYQYLYFNRAHKSTMKSLYSCDIELGMNFLDCISSEKQKDTIKVNLERAFDGEYFIAKEEFDQSISPTNRENSQQMILYNPILDKDNKVVGATKIVLYNSKEFASKNSKKSLS
ncbi:MAG: PAS domain-containing protein [Oligoflexia bacterium]|nr:PAS domain-containing protein [Oligoflexia bacterium]